MEERKEVAWFFVGVPFPLTFSAQCKVIPPHRVSCVALWEQMNKSQRPQGHHPEQVHNRGTRKTISGNIFTNLYTPVINEAREWSSSFPRRANYRASFRSSCLHLAEREAPGLAPSSPSGPPDWETQTLDETVGHHLPFDFSLSAGFIWMGWCI